MKLLKLILIIVSFTSAFTQEEDSQTVEPSSNINCDSPPKKSDVFQCCVLPLGYNFEIVSGCIRACFQFKDLTENDDCVASCFMSITKLVKSGEIDKQIVKKLYIDEANSTKHHQVEKFIDDAVDKCDYDSTAPAGESLAKFYNCIEGNLRENCFNFQNTPECIPVAEYFENCKHTTNCNEWPPALSSPLHCCKVPDVIPNELFSECYSKCFQKYFVDNTALHCVMNCTIYESKLVVDNKLDFKIYKEMMIKSANNELWNKAIEEGIKICQKMMSALNGQTPEVYRITNFCMQRQLADSCVEFLSSWDCRRTENFMKKCPTTRPPNGVGGSVIFESYP